jgi:hypothetical protein
MQHRVSLREEIMISREANMPRKAMRVAIPLFVEIGGQTYAARDWSTTGIGLSELAATPKPGEVVHARLSFPMLESTLLIPVQLVYRSAHDGVHGFEFHDLSPRNRRILRHYIELSLDGKLGDVEDIVAAAALPGSDAPPQAPLMLGAPVAASAGSRRTRLAGSVLAGLAVLAAAAGIGYYNLTYQLEGTGFVSGSITRVTANNDGQLSRMLVEPGTKVEPNTPLFSVENPSLRNEIEAMEQHLGQLATQQARLTGARRSAEAGLLQTLATRLEHARERAGERAQALRFGRDHAARHAAGGQPGAGHAAELPAAGGRRRHPHPDARQLGRADPAAHGPRHQEDAAGAPGSRAGGALAGARPRLHGRSPGWRVRLGARPGGAAGSRRHAQRAAAHAERGRAQAALGMPATIYVPFEDRKYEAKVAAVGLSAASASAAVTQEGGLNETLVKLDFHDRKVRLPANARVNVWIRNPALPWS